MKLLLTRFVFLFLSHERVSALFRWIVPFNKWFVTSVFCNKASLGLFSRSERILLSRRCVTWLCLHPLSNDGLGSTKVSLERPDYLSCGGLYPSLRQAPLVSHGWQLFTSQSVDDHFKAQPTTLMKWEQSGSRIAITGHQKLVRGQAQFNCLPQCYKTPLKSPDLIEVQIYLIDLRFRPELLENSTTKTSQTSNSRNNETHFSRRPFHPSRLSHRRSDPRKIHRL